MRPITKVRRMPRMTRDATRTTRAKRRSMNRRAERIAVIAIAAAVMGAGVDTADAAAFTRRDAANLTKRIARQLCSSTPECKRATSARVADCHRSDHVNWSCGFTLYTIDGKRRVGSVFSTSLDDFDILVPPEGS